MAHGTYPKVLEGLLHFKRRPKGPLLRSLISNNLLFPKVGKLGGFFESGCAKIPGLASYELIHYEQEHVNDDHNQH